MVSVISDSQNSTSSSETESSSEPQSRTTVTTSSVPEVSEPQSSTVSTTSDPETSSSESNSQPEETLKDDTPQWTETAVNGERYVNTDYISSRVTAIQGSNTVKQYRLNDMVTIIAKTDTNYYKLDDGTFIHSDYLSESQVTAQQPTQPNGGNNGSIAEAKPYEGTKHKPAEDAEIIDTQTGVTRSNKIVTIYTVKTDGGTYYFNEAGVGYYRTIEDALNMWNSVPIPEVFPNRDYSWWSDIKVW